MKYAQLYIGVAGSGKSSCCKYVQEHLNLLQRKCYVVNWDVASENLPYEAYADVRDVIDIKAYQSDNFLGPNGALIEAMESISTEYDYLSDVFEDIEDSSFVLIDCPGQLELYSNSMAIFNLIKRLIQFDYSVICIFCMDIAFLSDVNKLLGSAIYALSSMVLLDAPFVCALTKWDLLDESSEYNQEDFSQAKIPYIIPRAKFSSNSNTLSPESTYPKINFNKAYGEDNFNETNSITSEQAEVLDKYAKDLNDRLKQDQKVKDK
ncbi:GPN-loop GTPase 3-like [Dermatophagoides farinae]|uniref:GPN-loop GTPase 3-like n=1 Tax=Dermatophagoides farinae TaxID=6954 RepID=UPI003F61D1C5